MAGILPDGFSTLIVFANKSSIRFKEKEVTPPGITNGMIDTTTMHNATWRTKYPKALKTLEETSAVVAYDPAVYTDIVSILGEITTVTVQFPDSTQTIFSGWLDEFKPNRMVEGQQPTAEIKIIATGDAPTVPS